MEITSQQHEFEPVYNEQSKVLILGTFPSVKSREQNFYYGHPQNRFWKVLAAITKEETPVSVEEKKGMLLKHKIAIWDVIASCDIAGSSDSSIRNVIPADISGLLKKTNIEKIFANGAMAKKLYDKYVWKETNIEIVGLPSTSPANAAWSLERLIDTWERIII